jgi:LAO/AO transport system kinase
MMNMIDKVLHGDRLALARLITHVENDTPQGQESIDRLFPHTGHAHLIGITGSSGAGKSTLVNALVKTMRQADPQQQVGVIAVDPTSPFSGGALLGDRVRMRDLAADPQVFVRSMATRGSLGGLASTTFAVALVLDAAGFNPILVETVGAGQAEVEIASLAHTTLVVEAPGLGDEVQAIKAGILEIADVLVVNKADRPGAEAVVQALKSMLEIGNAVHAGEKQAEQWIPPIIKTTATLGQGMPELNKAIHTHMAFLQEGNRWQGVERKRIQRWMELLFHNTLLSKLQSANSQKKFETVLTSVVDRELSPSQAIQQLIKG